GPPRAGRGLSGAYHARLRRIYRSLVLPGRRVLEVGCAQGDLLAALEPAHGVGVDLSPGMVGEARRRHPHLTFVEADAHGLGAALPRGAGGPFDAIILSDLANDLWDVQGVLEGLRPLCTARTRVIMNSYSRLWGWPLGLARRARLARPVLEQNWLSPDDVDSLLTLAGFEPVRRFAEVLCPLPVPGLAPLLNRVGVRLWPLRHLALTNFVVARVRPGGPGPRTEAGERERDPDGSPAEPSVSVIVPARNEAGNIEALLARVPAMGSRTELIVVEGHSTDDTWATLERRLGGFDRLPWALLRQKGRGKGDAVRAGFDIARGDILMILDADLTVAPEDLPRFYEALRAGTGEFVNGVRLVYPMERGAMRSLNLLGNKFFGLAFSWVLGQRVRDTLCGTKALWREDYRRIAGARDYFGDFDPFGDFDLIFGAARQSLRILDLPIRYRERTYGQTNISRFRHGLLLFRMLGVAARKLKFT
ncbi:MAG: bifunctional class I SAM-dependent methyltransferase/glycosyltransferase family 2 protein, partial [Phycisphaerales bacterium]